jgi:poly(hydroxyalkanoate) granule-associated protein
MSEDIEINVRKIHDEPKTQPIDSTSTDEMLQRLFMAGVGAISMACEESDKLIQQLVERGEEVQKENPNMMGNFAQQVRNVVQSAQESTSNEHLHTALSQILANLNIPSKEDLDALNAKIEQLAATIEEVTKSNKNK